MNASLFYLPPLFSSSFLPSFFLSLLQIDSNSRASLLEAFQPLRYIYFFPFACKLFPLRVYLSGRIERLYSPVETVDLPTRKCAIAYTWTGIFEFVTLERVNIYVIISYEKWRTKIDVVANCGLPWREMAIYRTYPYDAYEPVWHSTAISINNVQHCFPFFFTFFSALFSSADDKLKRHLVSEFIFFQYSSIA